MAIYTAPIQIVATAKFDVKCKNQIPFNFNISTISSFLDNKFLNVDLKTILEVFLPLPKVRNFCAIKNY